jgi:chromosome segregation ATPase
MIEGVLKKKDQKEELNDQIKSLEVTIARLEEVYSAKKENVENLQAAIETLGTDLGSLSTQRDTLVAQKEEAQVAAAIETSKVSAAKDIAGALIESVNKTNEAVIQNLGDFSSKVESTLKATEAELVALSEKKKNAIDADLALAKDTLKVLTSEINTLTKAKETTSEVLADANVAFAMLKEEMTNMQKEIAAQREAVSSSTLALTNFADKIRSSLSESLEMSVKAKENATQISESVAKTLADLNDASAKAALKEADINARFQVLSAKEVAAEKMVQFIMNSAKDTQA